MTRWDEIAQTSLLEVLKVAACRNRADWSHVAALWIVASVLRHLPRGFTHNTGNKNLIHWHCGASSMHRESYVFLWSFKLNRTGFGHSVAVTAFTFLAVIDSRLWPSNHLCKARKNEYTPRNAAWQQLLCTLCLIQTCDSVCVCTCNIIHATNLLFLHSPPLSQALQPNTEKAGCPQRAG